MALRATLTVEQGRWLRLTARNLKIRMSSEDYHNPSNAKRARKETLQDFVDVLEDAGFTVIPPPTPTISDDNPPDGMDDPPEAEPEEPRFY